MMTRSKMHEFPAFPAFLGALLCCLALVACYHGHGLSPTGEDAAGSSGISGTIRFVGIWPDSTKQVNVIASKTYPEGLTDPDALYAFVFNELGIGHIVLSDTIPRHSSTHEYVFNLKPGLYEWILVVWFPDIQDYYFGVKELGAYYVSSAEYPEPVYIKPGEIVENIDIVADFDMINRDIPFFKR
ncbi:hypothetical protein JW948_09125 [bacterium]|nr:hypothetical protein [bacterium]